MSSKHISAGAVLAALLAVAAPLSAQQTATTPTNPKPDSQDDTIALSPFVVSASEDANSYQANSTLAGTRVRTDLRDVASSISVVTQQFLQDTGAKNERDLLIYTPSTEVGGVGGNFSGVASSGIYTENTVETTTRVRGLDSADNTRDYYLTDIPFDSFNVGRVDLQRGPNSILFGIGSPAGIINASTNDAAFKTTHNYENVIDQWGSIRNSLDLNQVLIPDQLAIRVSGVINDAKFEQKPAFNNDTRYYGALRFDPKIFNNDTAHTSIRAKYEKGRVRSDNPRDVPPVDEITPWFRQGVDANGNLGLNKFIINEFSLTNTGNPAGIPLPGISGGALSSATFETGGWAQSRTYWPDIINYFEVTPKGSNTAGAVPPSPTPIFTIAGQPNKAKGLTQPASNGDRLDGLPTFRPDAIPSESQYAPYVGTVTNSGGANANSPAYSFTYPGKAVPGGVYYADTVLTDPSIFNFYKNLLDGPNKKEWRNWQAINVAVDQTFFGDRLAFEVAVDHQAYDEGTNQWMTGSNYAINVDVNATYADGSPNPNAGRPYVANAASNPNTAFSTVRNTVRVTATGELRAEDFLGKTKLAEILGRHTFTGLYDRYTLLQNNVSWAEFATTPDYILDNFPSVPGQITDTSQLGSNREFNWLAYIGPSLKNASSAANAHLTNLNYTIAPPVNQQAVNFNSTWNKPTDPATPGYVDPAAPYTYTDPKTGQIDSSNQSQNPANYVGWSTQPITWMRASNPNEYPSLVTSASRTRFRDISEGITWQGHLLGDDLVPTFGYRKDRITNYNTSALKDTKSGFVGLDYPDDLSTRTDVAGISRSWGGVYHLPRSLVEKLPWDSTISFFYDHSANFKADAQRLDLSGNHIPNATGLTKEYGVTITTLHDKLSLKITRFKTQVANATLESTNGNDIGGLGNNGYFLADGVIWGYDWATALQDGLRGQTPNNNYWDYASGDGLTPGTAAYTAANAASQAIVDAWLHIPLGNSYFASFNLQPPMTPAAGSASGNLRDSFPQGFNDATGVPTGGGSTFGDHQTTVDNLSKGTEIELTAQPIKNWNMSINYAKVTATHVSVDAAAQHFIGEMTAFMNGPGGLIRMWGNNSGNQTLQSDWNSSIAAPFTVLLNQQGHQAPEVSPWRLNAVTTYNFDRGVTKGFFIGGALRVEAGRIIGYKYDPNFKNINASDPNYAAVSFITQGGLNVNEPFIGKKDEHLDGWIGYSRKLTHNVNWRIQLNLSNIGEKDHLVDARINPDGSLALASIGEGMSWRLTNSFDF